jgi:hypothetical protein
VKLSKWLGSNSDYDMTTIRAYRERPITQSGQVERVLIKFGIGPDRGFFASASASNEEERRMFEEAAKNAVPTNFIPTAEQMKASEGRMCRDITVMAGALCFDRQHT